MKLPRRTFLHLAAGAAALPSVSCFAWAQAYPTRPITMIVPFPAGGGTDVLARIMAERMRISLGQSIVIENVTGGYGTIGVGRTARAAPDGYTIDMGQLAATSCREPLQTFRMMLSVILSPSVAWAACRCCCTRKKQCREKTCRS